MFTQRTAEDMVLFSAVSLRISLDRAGVVGSQQKAKTERTGGLSDRSRNAASASV